MKQKRVKNEQQKFYCEKCDYECRSKYNFNRHLYTTKHKMKQNETNVKRKRAKTSSPTYYRCEACSYSCKSRTTLWRHKKTHAKRANKVKNTTQDKSAFELMRECVDAMTANHKILCELAATNQKITNMNYSNTNNISIHMFLNEHCSNAINLTDFMNNMKLSLEDLEYSGKHGYVKGISNILVKNLADVGPTERPIHCSDTKRLQFYVKDEDKWERDKDHKRIDRSIDNIGMMQLKHLKEWICKNPDYESDQTKLEEYHRMVRGLMGGCDSEEQKRNKNKIIKHVSDKVYVKEVISG